MDAKKGVMNPNRARQHAIVIHARTILLTLSCLPVLFAGCAQMPAKDFDFATNCEAYGVIENHAPMGTMVHIKPLYRDELKVRCAGVPEANAAEGTEISGCTIPHPDGVVESYYWVGDQCAMNHELCHFRNGPGHTERYLRELREGIPMPYCPSNQLKLKG